MKINKNENGEFWFERDEVRMAYETCHLCNMYVNSSYSILRNKLKKFIKGKPICCLCWIHKHHDIRVYKYNGCYRWETDGELTEILSADIREFLERRNITVKEGWNEI